MPATFADIVDELRRDLVQFRTEVSLTNATLVRPTWKNHSHHFPVTLYSYLMAAFARVDVYSRLWCTESRESQTSRMRRFLKSYLPREPLAHAIAIQLWRHTLMHTARPRRVLDQQDREYSYLLHWGPPELPQELHYRIERGNQLVFGLEHFLADLDSLLEAYVSEAASSPELQSRAEERWPTIQTQKFRL